MSEKTIKREPPLIELTDDVESYLELTEFENAPLVGAEVQLMDKTLLDLDDILRDYGRELIGNIVEAILDDSMPEDIPADGSEESVLKRKGAMYVINHLKYIVRYSRLEDGV